MLFNTTLPRAHNWAQWTRETGVTFCFVHCEGLDGRVTVFTFLYMIDFIVIVLFLVRPFDLPVNGFSFAFGCEQVDECP